MLKINLDEKCGIAVLEPDGALAKSDFEAAAAVIDPYLEKAGKLNGIIVHVKSFPGWDSFAALVKHLKFIRDHHRKVARLAFVTDSPIGGFAEHVARHFVSAEIRHFSYSGLQDAQKWISTK